MSRLDFLKELFSLPFNWEGEFDHWAGAPSAWIKIEMLNFNEVRYEVGLDNWLVKDKTGVIQLNGFTNDYSFATKVPTLVADTVLKELMLEYSTSPKERLVPFHGFSETIRGKIAEAFNVHFKDSKYRICLGDPFDFFIPLANRYTIKGIVSHCGSISLITLHVLDDKDDSIVMSEVRSITYSYHDKLKAMKKCGYVVFKITGVVQSERGENTPANFTTEADAIVEVIEDMLETIKTSWKKLKNDGKEKDEEGEGEDGEESGRLKKRFKFFADKAFCNISDSISTFIEESGKKNGEEDEGKGKQKVKVFDYEEMHPGEYERMEYRSDVARLALMEERIMKQANSEINGLEIQFEGHEEVPIGAPVKKYNMTTVNKCKRIMEAALEQIDNLDRLIIKKYGANIDSKNPKILDPLYKRIRNRGAITKSNIDKAGKGKKKTMHCPSRK